jgi:formiminotetrahydrofolate cyclodeaminase
MPATPTARFAGVHGDPLELPLRRLFDDLSSSDAAPASGSAAAVTIAMAAALAEMGAGLSRGQWDEAAGMVAQARLLRRRIAPLVEADADAYARALAALDSAGASGAGGDDDIARALAAAADVLLVIARTGADTAEVAQQVAERGNPRHRDDVHAAVLLAEVGTRIAATLVSVNLATVAGDLREEEAIACARAAASARDRIPV